MAKLAEKGLLATQRPDETSKEEMGTLLQETQSEYYNIRCVEPTDLQFISEPFGNFSTNLAQLGC